MVQSIGNLPIKSSWKEVLFYLNDVVKQNMNVTNHYLSGIFDIPAVAAPFHHPSFVGDGALKETVHLQGNA